MTDSEPSSDNAAKLAHARARLRRALRMLGNALNEQRQDQIPLWIELARRRVRETLNDDLGDDGNQRERCAERGEHD